MSIYTLFCKFDTEQKKLIKKNPHTLHFFCHIDNIKLLGKYKPNNEVIEIFDHCKNYQDGYFFKRYLQNDVLNSSNINFDLIKKLYFQNTIRLKIDKNFPKLPFEPRRQRPTSTLHYGQLKLFATKLQFFINNIPKNKEVHILYPGSAPGNSIYILSKLLPNCFWYLIDPSPFYFKLEKNKKILHIENKFFTNDDAKYFKEKLKNKYTVFISDIRDIKLEDDNNYSEAIINTDMDSQYNWCKIFNADISFLKFRIPRFDQNKYTYFEGEIFIQPFANTTTTETRLVCKKNAKDKIYDLNDYEDKLYYHNRILRVCDYSKLHKYKYKYFCNCYDCSLFFLIIEDYIKKYNNKTTVYKIIDYFLKNLYNSNRIKAKYTYIIQNIH